jgi:hypothetical protein
METGTASGWLFLGGALILGILTACDGDQSSEETTPSPSAAVITLCELGFTPVVLHGLPEMTDPEFTYILHADDKEIDLRYKPLVGATGTLAPDITVYERPQAPALDPPYTYEIEIEDSRVLVDEYSGTLDPGMTSASVAAYWSQGGVWISASFTWVGVNGESTLLSDEMREIALDVVEGTIRAEPVVASPVCG